LLIECKWLPLQVIERAKEGETLEELRARTAAQSAAGEHGGAARKKSTKRKRKDAAAAEDEEMS